MLPKFTISDPTVSLFITAFDKILESRGLPVTTEYEERLIKDAIDGMLYDAKQTADTLFDDLDHRINKTGIYDPDY